jgi:hypothetical protein
MFDEVVLGGEFFAYLTLIDEATAAAVASKGCPHCEGPLHRGDYPRKPRGGRLGASGEGAVRRVSLCCGRRGCRRRATPPSVRFLGRRVYLAAVLLLASMAALVHRSARRLRETTGVPPRTVGRWRAFWTGAFLLTAVYGALRARVVPPFTIEELPRSLLERFAGDALVRLRSGLCALAPMTTHSVPDGSRFVRDIPAA